MKNSNATRRGYFKVEQEQQPDNTGHADTVSADSSTREQGQRRPAASQEVISNSRLLISPVAG
jgi:hypothetical protein